MDLAGVDGEVETTQDLVVRPPGGHDGGLGVQPLDKEQLAHGNESTWVSRQLSLRR
jgi:hypothetical protein